MKTKNKQNVIAACLLPLAGYSQAAIIFEDTFNRADAIGNPNVENIQQSLDGITNNTGTAFTAAGGAGAQPYSTPNGGANRTNIEGNALFLADGNGTSNAFVNHNFTNSNILSSGGFSVTLDITSGGNGPGTNPYQGGAFGIGMSLVDAGAAGDANSGNPKMVGAFSGTPANVISDFWVGLTGASTVRWGTGNTELGNVTVGGSTGTISADFTLSDFDDGSTVGFSVFYNGAAVTGGTGDFTWNGGDENYIGLDGLNPAPGIGFDNFRVSAIPEPGTTGILGMAACSLLVVRRRK